MITTDDLFTRDELAASVRDGYVRVGNHLTNYRLSILNYTPKAQYDNHWDAVTRVCRGLIVDRFTYEVVARPFSKFFNYGDAENAVVIDGEAPVEVTDKIDGSLGILYPDPTQPTGWAVATRGSFHSVQAEHATVRYQQTHYQFRPRPELTYLFEIVYPENRVVVDYGRDDNLYLIGIVRNADGKKISVLDGHVTIPRTTVLRFGSFGDFLTSYKPKRGVEGVVVRDLSTDKMLKFKTEEYVALHRITFGLNATVVWEKLVAKETRDLLSLPTAYLIEWAQTTADNIISERRALLDEIADAYNDLDMNFLTGTIVADLDDQREFRKNIAGFILSEYPHLQKYLFALVDGRQIDTLLWRAVKPRGDNRPTLTQESDG